MRGLKTLAAVLSVAALLAAVVPAGAGAAAYKHYVGCGVSQNAKPSHSCPKQSKKGAFFRSNRGVSCLDPQGNPVLCVYYKVCVRFPDGRNLCANRQQAIKGVLYVNRITSNIPGRHRVSWFVEGKKVGLFVFNVTG
ncbi:MAG TPA: hypothetical protein VNM89_03130 [Solirubrobacterales bacterium]|nr:hypothetical protein [Solirubrobacterales bacterium]